RGQATRGRETGELVGVGGQLAARPTELSDRPPETRGAGCGTCGQDRSVVRGKPPPGCHNDESTAPAQARTIISHFFIDRPIVATVLSIVIVIVGLVALFTLPIAQYPDVTPPTVQVTATYPGANAKTVADTVAFPIEQEVNGVERMLYMSSRCTNDGQMLLD